jgi:hypothetical protein
MVSTQKMGAAGSPEMMEPIHILEDYILNIHKCKNPISHSYSSVLFLNTGPTEIKNTFSLKLYQIPAFSKRSTF